MSEDIRGAASGFVLRWTVLCGLGLAGGDRHQPKSAGYQRVA